MLRFREWLVVEEAVEAVYDDVIAELTLTEAVRATVCLVGRALSGGLFSESSDPANPEDKVAEAKKILELARKVRWSAIIERKGLVASVKKAFDSEYLPMVRETAVAFEKLVEAERRNQKNPESAAARGYAETNVARTLEISKAFLQRIIQLGLSAPTTTRSESSDYDDEEIEMPDELKDEEPASANSHMAEFEEKFKSLSAKIGPLLVKMGYIDEEDMQYGSIEEKFKAFDEAIKLAAFEKNNEVPKNNVTRELETSPEERSKSRQQFMGALWELLKDNVGRYGSAGTASFWNPAQQRFMDGEHTPAEQFFNDFVVATAESLQRRASNKAKGDAEGDEENEEDEDESDSPKKSSAWNEPTILQPPSGDESEWAAKYINSLKRRLSKEALKRDQRERNRAGGLRGNSDQGPDSLQSGGREEDGSTRSRDVADFRGSTADKQAIQTKRRENILDALVYALNKLRHDSPLQAVLVCVRFGLGCDQNGRIPADQNRAREAVSRILEIGIEEKLEDKKGRKSGENILSPQGFLAKLGVADDVGGAELANQEFVQRLQSIPGVPPRDSNGKPLTIWDTLGRSPSPKDRDGNPITRKPNDPEGLEKWKRFLNTSVDAMAEAFKKLIVYMRTFLANTDDVIANGRIEATEEDGERWDFETWARRAFSRNSKVSLESLSRGMFRMYFLDTDGKVKFSWTIKVSDHRFPGTSKTGQKIEMVRDGSGERHEDFVPPMERCERCDGQDEECPECRGFGYVLNYPKVTALEGRLFSTLIKATRGGSKES